MSSVAVFASISGYAATPALMVIGSMWPSCSKLISTSATFSTSGIEEAATDLLSMLSFPAKSEVRPS